eukprot:TRINITY_DN2582_c0_g1_i3.p1 TRINITY_DN2582_c0_g1~~TRINITY_DN2582_c0_g1_i3.p1  ORF type:complete len:943 (+),score=179.47 TRINITY_DN2582_c0_g1_i3:70-2898(+)
MSAATGLRPLQPGCWQQLQQQQQQGQPPRKKPRLNPMGTHGTSLRDHQLQLERRSKIARRDIQMQFATPGRERDHKSRPPGHKDYNERRMYVPDNSLAQMPDKVRAFWSLKRHNFDRVLCFQKGNSWYLYGCDADVACRDGGEHVVSQAAAAGMRSAKVDGSKYAEFAANMIDAGHRLARVHKVDKGGSEDEGNWTVQRVDQASTLTDQQLVRDRRPRWFVAVKDWSQTKSGFALVACDCTRSTVCVARPADAEGLRCLLHRLSPEDILLEKRHCAGARPVCLSEVPDTKPILLTPRTEFLSAKECRSLLQSEGYFSSAPEEVEGLQEWWSDDQVMSAFGAVLWHLRRSCADQILRSSTFTAAETAGSGGGLYMDSSALRALCVLRGECSSSRHNSLLNWIDHTATGPGKRLLQHWVASPLRDAKTIRDRQDAVCELAADQVRLDCIRNTLRHYPDIERLVSYVMSGVPRAQCPDTVTHEPVRPLTTHELKVVVPKYAKAVRTLQALSEFARDQAPQCKSPVLSSLFGSGGGCKFPQLGDALADGDLAPMPGAWPQYDERVGRSECLERDICKLHEQYRSIRGCKLSQVGTECSATVDAGQEVPADWEKIEGIVGGERETYKCARLCRRVQALEEASAAVAAERRKCFDSAILLFGAGADLWRAAVRCTAEVDALCSLAVVAGLPNMTRPDVCDSDEPLFEADGLVHPLCKPPSLSNSEDWSPVRNTLSLSGNRCMVLMGPNMGGKTTLMRSVAVSFVLAQIGSFVPAYFVRLTPTDRIFVRMGAGDEILSGRSTFFLEMSETSSVLRSASRSSLVLLDELGRGTSSSDGEAVAEAALHHLCTSTQSRCIFATHYHTIAGADLPVDVQHMGFTVHEDSIDFTYKLVPGSCRTSSYATCLARRAGVTEEAVAKAEMVSQQQMLQRTLEEARTAYAQLCASLKG